MRPSWSSMLKKDGHEIELLREITFSGENVDRITEEAGKLFVSGHDRLNAKPTTQQEHGAVLLTGDDVVTFFRYLRPTPTPPISIWAWQGPESARK